MIESIIERSGTPYFSFKDIDENRPSGSIKIRVETIHYFLKRYAEDRKNRPQETIDEQVADYERALREQLLREQQFAELEALQRTQLSGLKFLPIAGQSVTSERHVGDSGPR